MLGSALGAYNIYLKQTAIRDTNLNVRIVSSALTDFLGRNGRYPCPASMTAQRTDPAYGREDCTTAVTAGVCANGLCGQTGQRTVGSPAITPVIRAGAVPFRQLNLREEEALDAYGARLAYAITETQTSPTTYLLDGGAIDVQDGSTPAKSILKVPGAADFVVLSYGPDNAGAILANGTASSTACPAGQTQSINCSFDANAIYRFDNKSTSGTAAQFDDTVSYYARGEQTPWTLTAVGDDMYNKNTVPGKIGINTDTVSTDTDVKLQIVGNARAREKLSVDDFVQVDDSTTMTPAAAIGGLIDGSGDDIDCTATDRFVTGISGNQEQCGEWATGCPKGTVMTGIDAEGAVVCQQLSCAPTTVTLCSTAFNLPQGRLNRRVTLGPAGIDLRKTFICRRGEWVATRTTGACTCTPRTITETVPCGPGLSGTKRIRRSWTCPDNTWTGEVVLSNSCRCIGGNQTRTIDCPPGEQGSITQRRTFSCTGAAAGTWSDWTTIRSDCRACSGATRTRQINCPDGDSGKITQQSIKNCSTGRWGAWTETGNTCTCTGSQSEVRTQTCPPGQVGTIRQQRTRTCGAGWTVWATISNTCTPSGGDAICRWKSNGGGLPPSTIALGNAVRSTCSCEAPPGPCYQPMGSGKYKNFMGCSCE